MARNSAYYDTLGTVQFLVRIGVDTGVSCGLLGSCENFTGKVDPACGLQTTATREAKEKN